MMKKHFDKAELSFLGTTPKESEAIWAHARTIVDAWYAEYERILSTPDVEVELGIERNEADFSKGYYSNTQKKLFEHTPDQYQKTRTTDTLSNWASSPYKTKDYPRDSFCGWKNEEMRQEATGFFYVKKLNGRWWYIDPEGYPCIVRCMIGPLFSYNNNKTQEESATALYGTRENWANHVVRHLKDDLSFNTVGLWRPDAELVKSVKNGMVYQKSIDVITAYGNEVGVCSKQGSTFFDQQIDEVMKKPRAERRYDNVMPVFDPGFEEAADRIIRTTVEPLQNDPQVIGFTTDNEIPMNRDLLDRYLFRISPDFAVSRYSYAAAWTWFRFMTGKENPSQDDVTDELRELFRGFVYYRYFSVVGPAAKKYMKNHPYCGVRFLTGPERTSVASAEWVIRFAAQYADIININWYKVWTLPPETARNLTVWSGDKPFVISEFGAKSNGGDSTFHNAAGGWFLETQQGRADFYENFILSFLEWKNNIGWHWYRYNHYWIGDIPQSGGGVVDDHHVPYPELETAFDNINNHVYGLMEFFDNK